MVIELLSGFKSLSPFKDATVDDGWDQINRSYVFLSMVLMGSVTTMQNFSGTYTTTYINRILISTAMDPPDPLTFKMYLKFVEHSNGLEMEENFKFRNHPSSQAR